MHVDHELVDFMPVGEPEYVEVIEEYEEEILVQEGAQEPVGADPTKSSSLVLVNWWNPKC